MRTKKFEQFSEIMNKAFEGWKATFDLKPTKKLLKQITGLTTRKKIKNMYLVILEK